MTDAASATTSALTAAAPLSLASKAGVAILGIACLGTTVTAAWAAWSVSGSSTGTAASATAQPLTVAVAAVTGLYPAAYKDVRVTIGNPNEFPVALSSVTLSATRSDKTDCTTSNLLVGSYGSPLPKVAAGGSTTLTFTNGVQLHPDALNACQGVTFTLTANAAGASTAS